MNISILRSVFEAHLSLKNQENLSKTKILFSLRDFDTKLHGSISMLSEVINKEVERVWESLELPVGLEEKSKLKDTFDFSYVGIPHKEYKNKDFLKSTTELKSRFLPEAKNSLAKGEHHLKKTRDIPSSSLFEYMESLWGTVSAMEQLNIISHKESLTHKLCDKIAKDCFSDFLRILNDTKLIKKMNFGKLADSLYEKISTQYNTKAFPKGSLEFSEEDSEAARLTKVRQDQGKKLSEEMCAELRTAQGVLARSILEEVIGKHTAIIEEMMENDTDVVGGFGKIRAQCRDGSEKRFDVLMGGIIMGCSESQNIITKQKLFAAMLKSEEAVCALAEQKFLNFALHELDKKLCTLKEYYSTKETNLLWEKVSECRKDTRNHINNIIKNFKESAELSIKALKRVKSTLFQAEEKKTREILGYLSAFILQIVTKRFDTIFGVDEKGLPREWSEVFDIEGLWLEAKEKTLEVFEIYCNPKDFGSETYELPDINQIDHFSNEKKELIKSNLEFHMEKAFKDAQAQKRNSKPNLPLWAYLVFIVLGFNEFMWILKNPLYVVILAILAGTVYIYYQNIREKFSLAFFVFQGFKDYAFGRENQSHSVVTAPTGKTQPNKDS